MTEFGSDLILARLQGLHPKSIDLSLARIERLLAKLGQPELHLPPVIHIAGTNGKGSTLAMLDAMLTASGLAVHRYVSPHLVRFNERILVHGQPVDERLLANVLDECERANDGEPITFFEITTAAAFLAFTRVPADYLLLETGLGGRLDATNVIDRPKLTLITPISLDHESYLGDDLPSIAAEKAGIIKKGVELLSGPQVDEVARVLTARTTELTAPHSAFGRDWNAAQTATGMMVELDGTRLDLPRPALQGPHQIFNAGLATVAALRLGVDHPAIARGLREARWAARMQPITRGSLADLLPPGVELWLDGGHNPAAGEAIAETLQEIAGDNPVDLVVGMLQTKSVDGFLAPLMGRVERLRIVPVPDEPLGRDPDVEARNAVSRGWSAAASANVAEAIVELTRGATGKRTILVCGSLYLAANVLRTLP